MNPWLQRLLTILAGVGVGALGVLVPVTAPIALPASGVLVGWAIKHPADSKGDPGAP
jgi:hypothetical protein